MIRADLCHRPEQLHAGTMPVRTHVDESGLGVGASIFATVAGKDCIARVLLTYAITVSSVINPATVAIAPRNDRLRAMTVKASANNAQNPAAKANSVSGIDVSKHVGPFWTRSRRGGQYRGNPVHGFRVAGISSSAKRVQNASGTQ